MSRPIRASPASNMPIDRWEIVVNWFTEDGDVSRLAVTRRADGALLGELFLRLASKAALQAEIGYIFNPACFYFIHDSTGRAVQAICEVTNTLPVWSS